MTDKYGASALKLAMRLPRHMVSGYEWWVITASADPTDLWGFCDVAIGWFDDSKEFLVGVHDVIVEA